MDYQKTCELHDLIMDTLDLRQPDGTPPNELSLENVDSLEMAEMIQVLESRSLASISFEKACECETVQELADLAERAGWGEREKDSNEHMRADQ